MGIQLAPSPLPSHQAGFTSLLFFLPPLRAKSHLHRIIYPSQGLFPNCSFWTDSSGKGRGTWAVTSGPRANCSHIKVQKGMATIFRISIKYSPATSLPGVLQISSPTFSALLCALDGIAVDRVCPSKVHVWSLEHSHMPASGGGTFGKRLVSGWGWRKEHSEDHPSSRPPTLSAREVPTRKGPCRCTGRQRRLPGAGWSSAVKTIFGLFNLKAKGTQRRS